MNEHNGGFDWKTVWSWAFVVVVMVALAVSLYSIARISGETADRRYAFCLAQNEASRKQRILWKGVIASSEANEEEAYVFVGQKKFRVVFEQPNRPQQLAAFEKFINETYPIGRCVRGALSPLPATSSPTP